MIGISCVNLGLTLALTENYPLSIRYNWNLSSDGSSSELTAIKRPYFGYFLGVL